MQKIICLKCGDLGYTASPEHVRCECGGRLAIFKEVEPLKRKEKETPKMRRYDESLAYIK